MRKARPATRFSGIMFVLLTACIGQTEINIESNHTPQSNDMSVTTEEDTAYSFTLNVSDADNDTLTSSITTTPLHGTLTGSELEITYTPDSDYNGSDRFQYRVSDGKATSAISTVSIEVTPVNDAPTINGAPDEQVTYDTEYQFFPTATDADADDGLVFTIENQPSWAEFNSASGALSGIPVESSVGDYPDIIISVSDGTVSASLTSFSISVTTPKPAKKGIAIHQSHFDWSHRVSAVKPYWSYSWSLTLSQFQPDNIEFVPMKWTGSLNEVDSSTLSTLYEEKQIFYLLGYNEPDSATQANMTVEEAIALWPELEALNIPLVSPSPVNYGTVWMDAFMQQAQNLGLRIDFIGYHSYGGANADGFLNKIDQLYADYLLPVWITEFAVADWDTTTREGNRWSEAEVLSFMQTVLPELDSRDYVFRYAWFSDYSNDHLWSSALFDDDSNLTALGEYYASYRANNLAGDAKPYPQTPDDPDNLLTNGNFEQGNDGSWNGYENQVITVDQIEPFDGAFLGKLKASKSAAFSQEIELQANQSYTVSLYSKWASSPSTDVNVIVKQVDDGNNTRVKLPTSTNWTQTQFSYTAATTGTHVFSLWTPASIDTELYIDAVVLTP